MSKQLNTISNYLVSIITKPEAQAATESGIHVNPIVSEIATFYEKVRNAMDYREDEVVLRVAIERILKRRHFYGGSGKTIAAPLLRELTWARYFPDGSIAEAQAEKVEEIIDLYLSLRSQVLSKHTIEEGKLNNFIYHLISSHLTFLLSPNTKQEAMVNYMFHIMKDTVILEDDSETTRDAQIFIATRRAFAKDDLALLHYHLFVQYFGTPTKDSVFEIAENFLQGYSEINNQLEYPLRHKIFSFIKRATPPFLILEEILLRNESNIESLVKDEQALVDEITAVCTQKYTTIQSKIKRAFIRSLIFLILTKTIIALAVEGTFESIVYGQIMWGSIALNIIIPPIILAIAVAVIKTPGKDNTAAIVKRIKILLYDVQPQGAQQLTLHRISKKRKSILYPVFSVLWIGAFFANFGLIVWILNAIGLNAISQIIFIFFLTVVYFLIYRIYQTAHTYTVLRKQNILTPIVDFFFMPIARVGRYITEGFSQVNIFLVAIDLLIEAPFKGLFSFFEQWFMFLHSKREHLE